MQLTQALAILAFTGSTIVKADVGPFPSACQSVCNPVMYLTQNCDTQKNDQDNTYYNCVCGATGAASQIPLCYSCLNDNGDTDNDVGDIVSSCTLSSTSWTSGATPVTSITATGSASSSLASTTSGPSMSSSSTSGLSTSGSSRFASSTSNTSTSSSSASRSSTATMSSSSSASSILAQTGNGVATTGIPMAGAAAAAAVVALRML